MRIVYHGPSIGVSASSSYSSIEAGIVSWQKLEFSRIAITFTSPLLLKVVDLLLSICWLKRKLGLVATRKKEIDVLMGKESISTAS